MHKECGHFKRFLLPGASSLWKLWSEGKSWLSRRKSQWQMPKKGKTGKSTQSTFSSTGGLTVKFDFESSLDTHRIHGRNKLTKFVSSGTTFRSAGYGGTSTWFLSSSNSVVMKINNRGSDACLQTQITQRYRWIVPANSGRCWNFGYQKRNYAWKILHHCWNWWKRFSIYPDTNGSSNPTMSGSGKKETKVTNHWD